jgi:hypothetical protein
MKALNTVKSATSFEISNMFYGKIAFGNLHIYGLLNMN